MNNQNLQEEKNDSQPAATPLAASADSHQPVSSNNKEIADEKKDPQLAATPLAAAGSTNRNLEDEGSHQLSSVFDFNGNDIALDLPPEGSVVMVDSDIVPHLDLEKLFDNDVSKKRFTIDNAEEGGSVITLNDPVEVPSYSTQTLFLTGKANIPALERFCEREVKVELNQQFH